MGSDAVITGLGLVSPLGNDLESYWHGLLNGEVPIRPLDYPGTAVHERPTYLVPGAPDDGEAGRASGFALAAARSALADAGLDTADAAWIREAAGVCVGTGNGDSDLLEAERDGRRELSGLQWFGYRSADLLAGELGLHGPGLTVSTACAAGAYAVSLGAEMIRDGEAEVVLVGGTEAVCRPAMGAFLRLGAVDPVHCRPFDAERSGTVYGEGAAFLVLESAGHAAARGKQAYASVLGAGWSCDAHHVTAPDPSGTQALRAAREALERGGVAVAELGAVISHGTGTPANDSTESGSSSQLLGDRTPRVPVAAIKSALGHSGGAAGAFSCLTAALVVRHGLVPPVGTLVRPEDGNALRLVRGAAEPVTGRAALVNAYAFGGNNITVVIGEPAGPATTAAEVAR
ncbi:beta-ketoacyl-[acyl-carrier-protein] synthase family protein [Kitasatospora sp. NPDC056181]|uniref:beta-ketoacyl-[acyl-carrier-protein] synthase family protein n=1 Tax=Kitasatospora sp. NPDC056181 TaxID=3345737 RepID=UPI0035DB9241